MKHEHMVLFRLGQIWVLMKLAIARLVSFGFRDNGPIWIICDRGPEAGDNGYRFFLFLKKEHPELRVFFIISRSAPEWNELEPYADCRLEFGSMKHYLYLWRASHLMSTHIQGYFPYRGLGVWVKKKYPFYSRKKHIFLQHGVSKDYTTFLEYSNTDVDLTICSVKQEYDFFVQRYGYPPEKVALTGMCRYDSLIDESNGRNQILLVPTWREYIYKSTGFEDTDYYHTYASLITSKRLLNLLERKDMRLVFYPHHEMQRYLESFKKLNLSERIHIAPEAECDLSVHFRRSNIMITDYSSVTFDFAYMQKPILLYQFDRDNFQNGHYNQGWLDYDHCFGPVCRNEDNLIDELEKLIDHHLIADAQYTDFIQHLYPYHDGKNCERNYQAILRLDR